MKNHPRDFSIYELTFYEVDERILNTLYDNKGKRTIHDLVMMTSADLKCIRNVGEKTVQNLKEACLQHRKDNNW